LLFFIFAFYKKTILAFFEKNTFSTYDKLSMKSSEYWHSRVGLRSALFACCRWWKLLLYTRKTLI